jgi:hypothetical protein
MLITGIGIGTYFVTALVALQSAMPLKDMATSTATFGLVRYAERGRCPTVYTPLTCKRQSPCWSDRHIRLHDHFHVRAIASAISCRSISRVCVWEL